MSLIRHPALVGRYVIRLETSNVGSLTEQIILGILGFVGGVLERTENVCSPRI